MKAVVALLILYVGTFLVAIQGGSPTSVEAAGGDTATGVPQIDPAKDSDIRSLLDLVGAHDQVQEAVNTTAEQYREKLLTSVPNNERGKAFVNAVITDYEKRFNVDEVTEQLVVIYDKHYSAEEIKGLLQFYGSPLGQKVSSEGTHIAREIQEVTRAAAAKAVHEALQQAKEDTPGTENVQLSNGTQRRFAQRRAAGSGQQSAQQSDPQ